MTGEAVKRSRHFGTHRNSILHTRKRLQTLENKFWNAIHYISSVFLHKISKINHTRSGLVKYKKYSAKTLLGKVWSNIPVSLHCVFTTWWDMA